MIDRYARPEMKQIWDDEARYRSWARVERAHLETMVHRHNAPPDVLSLFDSAFASKTPAHYLAREKETGHDVIAFIAEIADAMGDQGRFLHRGLTSSDVLDTSLALRLLDSTDVVGKTLLRLRTALARRAFEHADTLCIGRTHGIHAEPLSFGQVLASHFAEVQRAHLQLLAARQESKKAKLSGAVGNYTQTAPDFEASVLKKLGLDVEPVATQVVPRDRLVQLANALEAATTAAERFALNLRHWARTELGEVLEPFGKKQKGSSAMPHKKNPILAENICGLARAVRGYASMLRENVALWHERDISHSSVERLALPDLFVTADFLLDRTADLVERMEIRPEVMQANLNRTGGLWASQSVLTALVESGFNRTEAYETLQSIALPLSAQSALGQLKGSEFLDALLAHKKIADAVGLATLKKIFGAEKFLASVPVVFQRVFGSTPLDARRMGDAPWERKVPALHRVVEVKVELMNDVLDPECKTLETSLSHEGLTSFSFRQNRTFVARIGHSPEQMDALVRFAEGTLHNPVMEKITVEVVQ